MKNWQNFLESTKKDNKASFWSTFYVLTNRYTSFAPTKRCLCKMCCFYHIFYHILSEVVRKNSLYTWTRPWIIIIKWKACAIESYPQMLSTKVIQGNRHLFWLRVIWCPVSNKERRRTGQYIFIFVRQSTVFFYTSRPSSIPTLPPLSFSQPWQIVSNPGLSSASNAWRKIKTHWKPVVIRSFK